MRGFGRRQTPFFMSDQELLDLEMRRSDEGAECRRRRASIYATHDLGREAYVDSAGCHRWRSNSQYPPDDVLADAGVSRENRRRCGLLRIAYQSRQTAEYRKAHMGRPRSDEEMFELRAEFPGETVVDVITGERIKVPGRRRR
jgi:hypothetical protein